MGLRRKARELALQFLYGYDLQKRSYTEDSMCKDIEEFCQCFQAELSSLPYAKELITGICTRQQELDQILSRYSHNWRVERMAVVDRNILRIAAYEICYVEDVPNTVAINEALEIAKHYAEPESVGFINGILDGVEI